MRSVPLFSKLSDTILARMTSRFKTEEVSLGNKLIGEGEDGNKFFSHQIRESTGKRVFL